MAPDLTQLLTDETTNKVIFRERKNAYFQAW